MEFDLLFCPLSGNRTTLNWPENPICDLMILSVNDVLFRSIPTEIIVPKILISRIVKYTEVVDSNDNSLTSIIPRCQFQVVRSDENSNLITRREFQRKRESNDEIKTKQNSQKTWRHGSSCYAWHYCALWEYKVSISCTRHFSSSSFLLFLPLEWCWNRTISGRLRKLNNFRSIEIFVKASCAWSIPLGNTFFENTANSELFRRN